MSYTTYTSLDWDGFDWDERKTGEDMDRAVPDPPGTHHHGYSRVEKERGATQRELHAAYWSGGE